MKRLVDAIINKWFCLHTWKDQLITRVNVIDTGEVYTINVYVCTKCGKFKKLGG